MIEKRKLSYVLGDLERIEISNDWRKCEGIKAKETETNMGLAQRDYSIKCGVTKRLMVVEGFWIWWCETHNQPLEWCNQGILISKIKELENKIKNAQKALG